MSFTAKDVMALRQKTGMGMMDCKKALADADGDAAKAEEIMRAKKKGKMDQRTERATGEGLIGIEIDGASAVMVEVRTETDFTARNDAFQEMVAAVTAEAMKMPAGDIEPNDVMTKRIDDIRVTTGENANFSRGVKLEGGAYGKYLHHDGKRAALIEVQGSLDDDLMKGICQHIVFHDPLGISEEDVPADELGRIREEAIEEAKESGKNEEIAAKIAEGKVRKHLEERTLLHQKYVLDESKTIKEVLPQGTKITRFVRYTLGG